MLYYLESRPFYYPRLGFALFPSGQPTNEIRSRGSHTRQADIVKLQHSICSVVLK